MASVNLHLYDPLPASLIFRFGEDQSLAFGTFSGSIQAPDGVFPSTVGAQGVSGLALSCFATASGAVGLSGYLDAQARAWLNAQGESEPLPGSFFASLVTLAAMTGCGGANAHVSVVPGPLLVEVLSSIGVIGECRQEASNIVMLQAQAGAVGQAHDYTEDITTHIDAQGGAQGNYASVVPSAECGGAGEWRHNTWRGPGHITSDAHEHARRAWSEKVCLWEYSTPSKPLVAEVWKDGTLVEPRVISAYEYPQRQHVWCAGTYEEGTPAGTQARSLYVLTYRLHQWRKAVWEEAAKTDRQWADGFLILWPRRHVLWGLFQDATRRWREWLHQHQIARRHRYERRGTWQAARRPPLIWPPPAPPEPPEPPKPFVPDLDLVLECRLPMPSWGPVAFDIGLTTCDRARHAGIVPRRVIIVVHQLSLTVDGVQIPCSAIEVRADRDSWSWSWSAQTLQAAMDLAEEQKSALITIDGIQWAGLVEQARLTRRHANITTDVGGRSLSALLAAPYMTPRSRIEETQRWAQQIAEDELYNTGWELSWETVDWLIPSGIFAYDSLTPIEALAKLARAVGAIVQTHPSQQIISVMPRYAVPSWELSSTTVDKTISGDLITSLDVTWRPETLFRGVWVSGETAGVLAKVFRTGTDGAPYARMVVDALITHIDAARERGIQILSAGGKRADVTCTMPVTQETGLIKPGQIVQITEPAMRGYVDSVAIRAGLASVIMTLNIEVVHETP